MKTKSVSIKSQISGLFLLAGMLAVVNAHAQSTDTWVGGSGNNFSALGNWTYSSGSGPVAAGDSLIFDVVGSTTPSNDLASLSFPSITYNGGALGFTISGSAFTNGTSTAGGTIITVNSANAQAINNNIILGNNNQTINLASGNLTLGGVISGAGGTSGLTLTSGGSETLTLNGANTYGTAGATTNSVGTIKIGNASAFGASRLYVANGATIDLNGNNLNVAFINNVGALSAGIIDNVSAGGTVTLKVGSGQGGVNAASTTYTGIDAFSGIIKNTTGTLGLTKVAPSTGNQTAGIMATASLMNGPAVLKLINANAYTGPTTINGGMLELNFGQANNGGAALTANIIAPASALVMAGGDLMVDEVGTAGAQTFSSLTLNAGASHIASYRNSSSAASVVLTGITRNPGSTVDFQSRPSGSSSNQKVGAADGTDTTTNVNANFAGGQQTILGGYATFNVYVSGGGGSWAVSGNTVNTAKTITGAPALTAGFTAAKDVDAAIGITAPTAMTINSLRFNTAGAYTVNTAGNIVIATGGILETLTVGANAVAINNNSLTSGNGQDLIIHQYDTGGAMTIGANIVDNGGAIGLTKSGPGALALTPNAANTFSGQLTLNAGTVTLGNANALNGVPAVVFGGMSQTLGGAAPAFTFANGTLSLAGNSVSVASLTASTDSSGTALVQNASGTPATLTVNGAVSTAFTGTLQDGAGGGALSLIKSGASTQTLGGTLSYSGSTTIGVGTLALTAAPSATTGYAVNGTLDVTALANSILALASPQTLSGSGTVSGNVTVASGAHTRPGATGVTNTITGNLTYNSGAKADFDLNTSATNAPNDQIVLSGTSSVLACGGIAVNINLMGVTLDTTNDYVLYRLTGGSASITNTFNSVPTWLGTVPANSGSYSIVTDVANKKVLLRFSHAVAPTVAGAANPATVFRNQSTFISVTNTPGGSGITNAYLDLTLIGGSPVVPLTLSAVANVYTNTIVIPAAAPVGSINVPAYATDTTPLTGSGNISLVILAGSEVWNGGGADDNWSSNPNWASGLAPGFVGDSVAFDGTIRPTPVMDNSYSVTSLTFKNTADPFTISSANGGVLTVTGGITNNSPNVQILNVPVAITATQVVSTAAGDLTLGGAVTGGGLTKVGNNTLFLTSGGNTYTGNTTISNGTVSISQNASIGGGQITLAGGTLASGYQTGTRLTLGNNLNVPAGNTGTILMSALNRLNGAATGGGGGILNINASGGQDDIAGSWNTYAGQINIFGGGTFRLFINGGNFNGFNLATVTMTNVSLGVSDNSTGNSFSVGALNVDSTATITGPFAGNSPNFIIGGLNQSDLIAGGIQGNTRITKVGTGNLAILSAGTATYTGQTIVSNGTLTVLGSISSSPVTNYAGATLAGTGTFGAVVDLEPASTITPVIGGYGTLNCGNDLNFNGATNVVHISTTNVDLIAVAGNLSLAGGAVRLVVGDTLTNGVYKLMTYGTLSGAAANLSVSGFSQSGKVAVLSDTTPGEIDLLVTTPSGANLIWASAGAQDNLWNIGSSINWSNGAILSAFNPGDHVTFNDSGAGNTTIDVRAAVQPSTMLVTGAQAYVFQSTTGTGRLSGPTNSLTLLGTGSLEIDMFNDFGGPTTIGSGTTLTAGNGSGAASIGTGLITNNGALVFNQTNNLPLTNIVGTGSLTANGVGTLTLAGSYTYTGNTVIGGGATLQAGIGNATGGLLGAVTDNGTLVMNQAGTIAINSTISGSGSFVQGGTSVMSLNVPGNYQGNTYVNHGTLKLGASNVLPDETAVAGSQGWLILDANATNAGTLDLNGFNDSVNVLQGLAGTVLGDITNSTVAVVTNTLAFGNDFTTGTNDYAGLVTENVTGGKIGLIKQGPSINMLSAANSYSGGTVVNGGWLLLHNNSAAGSGSITLNDGTTLGIIPNGNNSVFIGNNVFTAAGATVTNYSAGLSSAFGSLFSSGDANSTNVFTSGVSLNDGLNKQFQGFSGTVVVAPGAQLRFSSSTLGTNGGDNAMFDIEGTLNTRNGNPTGPGISLGALEGAGFLTGAGNAAGSTTYIIGAKGISSAFAGTIQDGGNGNASIVKVGAGKLTLSGSAIYTGSTTVNNGILALVDPVSLDSNPTINLGSATASIDVSGRADNTLNLGNAAAQTLTGIGTVTGNLTEAANSSVRAGLGILAVSGTATFNGNITLQLNRTNAITHSEITAATFAIGGPLTVTNVGPALQGGDTFQLFSTAVTGFTATNLPVLTGSMYWTNKLAVDGSIAVINPVNTTPTNITFSVTGNTLSLSWPADHTGWTLQVQTNSASVGLGTNWVDVPGSTTINSTNITINHVLPATFYRLKL